MIDFIKAKKNYLLMLAVFFVFVSLSETTYSLFLHQETTDEFNYNTGSLNLEFNEDGKLTLNNTFPTIDSEGLNQEPYRLTIKNTGNLPQLFTLKMLSDDEASISYNYIKVAVDSYLPYTLTSTNNIIASNILLYPNEERTFAIKIWLDYNTPNTEIGKSFTAKIIASGVSTYKTLDKSGANHPVLSSNMLPVSYNENDASWHMADLNNMDNSNPWYNYNEKLWANSVIVKDSSKYIFDTTRNNDLPTTNVKANNGNLIIDENYLDIGLSSYNYSQISQIIRVKITDLNEKQIYFVSNGNIAYYYDNTTHKFIFQSGDAIVSSSEFTFEKDNWYIIGYTYDTNKVSFYANGNKVGEATITGTISTGPSFKLGTNNAVSTISKLTVGDILTYNRLLTDKEISTNYKLSMNLINDGLVSAYQQFNPMTLQEYYQNSNLGTIINENDIDSLYVWIPRYKYRIWNITGKTGIDSYDAYKNGIDIIFENGNAKTGSINCQKNNCFNDNLATVPVSEVDNNKYYTHNAFTNNDKELLGLWISKYEVTLDNDKSFNEHITSTNKNSIITNSEWGAVAYLTHSNFGICNTSKCNSVTHDNDSTTGNITGIFDMAGGYSEYTSSLITNETNNNYETYLPNTFILGDATKELQLTNGIWNQNTYNNLDKENNWIIRGGNNQNNNSGLFTYMNSSDLGTNNLITRTIIK